MDISKMGKCVDIVTAALFSLHEKLSFHFDGKFKCLSETGVSKQNSPSP